MAFTLLEVKSIISVNCAEEEQLIQFLRNNSLPESNSSECIPFRLTMITTVKNPNENATKVDIDLFCCVFSYQLFAWFIFSFL